MSAAEYRKSGEEALEALDAEAAAAFFRAALAKDSSCVASLNGLADALIATGDGEGARLALTRSIQLVPDGHAERYMNLAQVRVSSVHRARRSLARSLLPPADA